MIFRIVVLVCSIFIIPSLSYACPDYRLSGMEIVASTSDLYDSQSFSVIAGGDDAAIGCVDTREAPYGYFATPPDFELYLSTDAAMYLDFDLSGACDTALLINTGAGNWFYDDDDGPGTDAHIRLTRPSPGRYDIWAGSINDECIASLKLETFLPSRVS